LKKKGKTGLAKERGRVYCLPPFGRRKLRWAVEFVWRAAATKVILLSLLEFD